ncbi:PREDICTED: uncharacterized protein LOC106344618 [Brassica oleracea var. oleracea]|uniref:uncharacterized protein LOC106344618 n=1 Tax=Brassica oleracea var. oleracea TaxID=109376 RepID=UPI0006A74273|nr:PREDICTED: uncharacterized protein LOC106344618 [Brassica oleracea var. oleracea]
MIYNKPIQHIGKIRFPTYDGNSDPRQYMIAFTIAMGRTNFTPDKKDAGYCQLFVENLSGQALSWFSRLESGSIDSYQQLSTSFLKHYSIYIEDGATEADLYTLSQERTESLRSFIGRFKKIVSRVKVPDKIATTALINALWYESKLDEDLKINKTQTLQDALHRSNLFIELEEDKEAMAKKYAATRTVATKDEPKEECHESRSRSETERKKEEGDRKALSFHVSDVQRPPRQAWNKWSREDDSTMYCEFHKRNEHSTMECRHLQEYLLGKYQRGEIKPPDGERTRTDDNRRDDRRRTPPRREPIRMEREVKNKNCIEMISPKRERPEERPEDNLSPPP